MRSAVVLLLVSCAASPLHAQHAQPYTLQQILSAPYATNLIAAPPSAVQGRANLFAWVEDAEGRHNLYIGGAGQPTRQLTHNTQDDAQDITQLAWSPDASAIVYTFGAERGASGRPANPAHLQEPTPVEVIVQPLAPDAKPIVLGDGRSPLFNHDGSSVLYLRNGQIWIADLVSPGAPYQLVFDRGSASDLTLSPGGTQLAFISHRSETGQPGHSFLALYDLRTRILTFPAPSTGNDSAPAFAPDGKALAWLRSPFTQPPEFAPNRTSPNPWSIQLLDLTIPDLIPNQPRTLFSPAPNQPGSVLPHLATGEPRLFFVTNNALDFFSEADGWLHLYEIDPSSKSSAHEVKWMTPGPAETEDVVFTPGHHTLLFASNLPVSDPLDRDRRHLWHLDLTQPDSLPIPLTSGSGIETHPAIAADGTIAALVSDSHTPMHPAVISTDGVITSLHSASPPSAYPDVALVIPQQVLFSSAAQPQAIHSKSIPSSHALSLLLHGQLFLPPTTLRLKKPAILFLHGGPNRQMLLGYPAMDYYSNAYAMNQYLTSRGFIVLSVNYRCGIGYGLDFRQCIHAGADGAEEYNDVVAAARYLRSRPDVDPRRIGIWGGSYGGYLTALALARNSNLFAAGVDFHGVHNWNLEDNATDWRIGTYAQRDALAAKALASSPLADLSRWTSPILLIHGDDDPDVAYAQTPTLADALRARNATLPPSAQIKIEELIFPDELHGFLLHRDWLAAYTAAAAFFERTLKP